MDDLKAPQVAVHYRKKQCCLQCNSAFRKPLCQRKCEVYKQCREKCGHCKMENVSLLNKCQELHGG